MIGIIGAMDEEVEQLVEVMEITREETKAIQPVPLASRWERCCYSKKRNR